MPNNFGNAALTYREPKPRDGRRCFSPLLRHGFAPIGAGAARSLPKSDSVGGPRFPGSTTKKGKRKKGLNAWLEFLPRYTQYKSRADVILLCDGLRNPLLHEYGTRGVVLIHANPQLHLKQHGEVRVLNINDLVAECGAAFESFCADIESDDELRARVLPRSAGLLSPVELAAGTQASVSSSLSELIPRSSALSASATGADGATFFPDNNLKFE